MKKESYDEILEILRKIPTYQMTVDQLETLSEARRDIEKAYAEELEEAKERKKDESAWIDDELETLKNKIETARKKHDITRDDDYRIYLFEQAFSHLSNYAGYSRLLLEEFGES